MHPVFFIANNGDVVIISSTLLNERMTRLFAILRVSETALQGEILKSLIKYYRVDRREIAFLKFILEAYDGVGTIKTKDPVRGVISLHIPPGCQKQVTEILRYLNQEILIEPVVPGPQQPD
jgi:hypothetical protein